MRLLRQAAIILGGTLVSTIAIAAPEQQAAAFMNIYSTHCLKYLHDFEGLRKQLSSFPQLPAEAAAMFLQGAKGNAWSVPSQHGQFIMVESDPLERPVNIHVILNWPEELRRLLAGP